MAGEISLRLIIITGIVVLITVGFGIPGAVGQQDTNNTVEESSINSQQIDVNLIARSDPGESVTVEVGETVALGFSKNTTLGDEGNSYEWEIVEEPTGGSGELLHTGTEDIEDEANLDSDSVLYRRRTVGRTSFPSRLRQLYACNSSHRISPKYYNSIIHVSLRTVSDL